MLQAKVQARARARTSPELRYASLGLRAKAFVPMCQWDPSVRAK